MANVNRPNGFTAISPNGLTLPMFEFMTKSNLTLNAGDAVIMLSTGVVDIATASSTSIFGVAQSSVTATAATRKKVLVVPAADNIVFSGQCSGNFAPVNVGEAVDIEGSTGAMMINEDAQSIGVAQLIKLEGGISNETGNYARVLFSWKKSQWNGQA